MAVWQHGDDRWEYLSGYDLTRDAWVHELQCLSATGSVAIVVPDATPDAGSFTPSPTDEVSLVLASGVVPWPVWLRFLRAVEEAGDLVDRVPPGAPTTG